MTKLLIYVGGAGVLGAALLVVGLVLSSDISTLGKGGVLVLCAAAVSFTVFTGAAYQTAQTSGARNYQRLALMSWYLGAAAMAYLLIGAVSGLL